MRLVFIYIDHYKSLTHKGFKLGSEFIFNILKEGNNYELSISPNYR